MVEFVKRDPPGARFEQVDVAGGRTDPVPPLGCPPGGPPQRPQSPDGPQPSPPFRPWFFVGLPGAGAGAGFGAAVVTGAAVVGGGAAVEGRTA
jgi:hypothetical protein